MAIEAANRPRSRGLRHRDASGTGSAAEIDHLGDPIGRRWQRFQDFARDEQVLRSVEKGERRALALRRQGTALGELVPALDVARRERAQRARDLAQGEVGQMPLLECLEPGASQRIHGAGLKSLPGATPSL